jgi:hypothetical protein
MSVTVKLIQATRKEAVNTRMKTRHEQTQQGTQKARIV